MSKEHTHRTVQMGILYETNLSKNLYVSPQKISDITDKTTRKD